MAYHGGDIYSPAEQLKMTDWMDFSANINPFGVPDSVSRAMTEAVPQLIHYPDPYQRKLRHALAEYHQIHPGCIVCGNGGADVIFRTVRAVAPRHGLVPVPTFTEYEEALQEIGCQVTQWHMGSDFTITPDLLREMEQGDYDFLVLCNPNNPTGAVIPPALLQEILRTAKRRQMFVLLDECFYEMTEDESGAGSALGDMERYGNLLIVRSMTKLYAIPGLRLGYGICSDPARVEQIRTTGQPWPVSTLAAEAGCAALKDQSYRARFLSFLQEERGFLYNGLQQLGFRVWKPHANYVFFQTAGWQDLEQRLLPYHILLRNCGTYPGLDKTYYRAAVRTRQENQCLLRALAKIQETVPGAEPKTGFQEAK